MPISEEEAAAIRDEVLIARTEVATMASAIRNIASRLDEIFDELRQLNLSPTAITQPELQSIIDDIQSLLNTANEVKETGRDRGRGNNGNNPNNGGG